MLPQEPSHDRIEAGSDDGKGIRRHADSVVERYPPAHDRYRPVLVVALMGASCLGERVAHRTQAARWARAPRPRTGRSRSRLLSDALPGGPELRVEPEERATEVRKPMFAPLMRTVGGRGPQGDRDRPRRNHCSGKGLEQPGQAAREPGRIRRRGSSIRMAPDASDEPRPGVVDRDVIGPAWAPRAASGRGAWFAPWRSISTVSGTD
jgi:hypothetical protein